MGPQRHDDDVWLFVVAGAFGLFFTLLAGGLLSAWLSGHGLPTHHVAGALSAFAHTSDPVVRVEAAGRSRVAVLVGDVSGLRRHRCRRVFRNAHRAT